jgi:hypothetical protein
MTRAVLLLTHWNLPTCLRVATDTPGFATPQNRAEPLARRPNAPVYATDRGCLTRLSKSEPTEAVTLKRTRELSAA